ncbi:unnamed protein product [Paramecium primaurelia]|uniref:Group 1 truncated hemoglobin n=2 Tax=Paramecium TaxID=5884 RepID=A0A8S1WHR4_9CILI|nr:unnamed protein product [Paramecium primaurelia]CAD8188521.1 unnamed protein product [Paramecium pentaurelia]
MDQSMFEQFGGDGQISDLIDQFYYKVLFDQSLRSMFLKADMTRVRLQQKTFFAQMFGCIHTKYTGKDLIEVHKNLSITDQQFDRFLHHLKCILADMNKPQELIDEILKKVDSHRNLIVFK